MTPDQKKRANAANKRWSEKNRDKKALYRRKHYMEHRKKYLHIERERAYRKLYGIGLADYDRMLLEQNGKCVICDAERGGRKGQFFSVDHDHDTGEIRGLLCTRCNWCLGWYERRLAKIVSYLKGDR